MKSVNLLAILTLSAMIMSFTPASKSGIALNAEFRNSFNYVLLWKSEEVDLGNIPQGKPVTVKFEFTNKGKEEVIITNVATSCGCTIADYEKKPIAAGISSIITATYNAAAVGTFTKGITVTFANGETKVLNIKGTVTAAKE